MESQNTRLVSKLISGDGSTGRLRAPCVLRHAPGDAFKKISKLCRRDRDDTIRRRRPDEATTLKPLREQSHALSVMPQHLDEAPATPAEHEQMATVRVALERLLDQKRQAIKALAHIGVACR
jgi:hypothetical protein